MKIENITNNYLKKIAQNLKNETQGLGFALILFEFNQKNLCRYISNGQRQDMIKALEETISKLKKEGYINEK